MEVFIALIIIVYLIAGLAYALYIGSSTDEPLIFFPFNIVAGPIVGAYLFYLAYKNKKVPF